MDKKIKWKAENKYNISKDNWAIWDGCSKKIKSEIIKKIYRMSEIQGNVNIKFSFQLFSKRNENLKNMAQWMSEM